MAKHFSSDSNISIDSLEQEFKKKIILTHDNFNENIDTILVPFYEKDVLIKVPKDAKPKHRENHKQYKANRKQNKGGEEISNYLVNKGKQKSKHISYLEIFRKQLVPYANNKKNDNEIRSLSPEVGDSVRDNFSEDITNPSNDFFNTECYNEIYYEQLLSKDFEQYLDYSIDEDFHLPQDIANKMETVTGDEINENNFKSISEVSQHRRRARRMTVQPIQNINLGGLGPDMEKIKPSLERARSLQRYSERVRMENRVRIYKKTIEDEMNRKSEREQSARLRVSRRRAGDSKNLMKDEEKQNVSSYLVNKATPNVASTNEISQSYSSKVKSADIQKTRERNANRDQRLKSSSNRQVDRSNERKTRTNRIFGMNKENKTLVYDEGDNRRSKLSANSKANTTKIQQIKTEAPVHISFLVNIGGLRPSSALRTLEEKHRMYQEKVKAYTMNGDNI
ncbi:hypothetical protein K1T71_005976 [Dendrolimus kikuchii]|uniref:Uncharacterized protein n=1 Tax=Dendrolimus kikuchii TaxID=765133 RepID=A0ACC1D3I0_9NEOP|nr:hypothetical protein K1T71_005976 [Dendrolimus kikuchii]